MNRPIVTADGGVTLAGGAPFSRALLEESLSHAPRIVAADAGADRLLRLGVQPEAVIGDFDSISRAARTALAGRLHPISEQETTDFDKALRSVDAPFTIGLGFTGARLDHGLAVLNALARHPERRCLILGARDVTFLAPPRLDLDLPAGTRLSLFPLGPVTGESRGLNWPIGGIDFAPGARIGTSNRVTGPVSLDFDAPAMLVILPRRALGRALDALVPGRSRVRGG